MPTVDDGYDDRDSPRAAALGPLDKTFRDTNIFVIVIVAFCCALIGLPLGLVGYFTAKDPKAKSNAMIMSIISGVMWALSIVANVLQIGTGFVAGAK